MGIQLTKYESATQGNIRFDVSKFDYSYDSDTFPADSLLDFQSILFENGDFYTLQSPATTEDSMGNVLTVTNTESSIYGMFQDITIKDRKIADMGLAVQGNRKFYCMPSYTTRSGGVASTAWEVKEGDIIKDIQQYGSGTTVGKFRVVKILKQWWESGTEVYRVCIVQNIGLDGTA